VIETGFRLTLPEDGFSALGARPGDLLGFEIFDNAIRVTKLNREPEKRRRVETKQMLSVSTVKRRVWARMKLIEEIEREFRELQRMVPAPTLEDYAGIVGETHSLSFEALWLAVLERISFHLSEAGRVVEDYARYQPSTVARLETDNYSWRQDLLQSLGNAVEFRAKGLDAADIRTDDDE
jgi:hypothetical protein